MKWKTQQLWLRAAGRQKSLYAARKGKRLWPITAHVFPRTLQSYPLQLCLFKYELDIHAFFKCLSSFLVSLQK